MAGSAQGTAEDVVGSTEAEKTLGLEIRLLGAFEVSVAGRFIAGDAWRLQKAASLIKLLSLAPGHRLHRDQVLDLLWPDHEPAAASNNLHYTLHVARRVLDSRSPSVLRLKDGILSLGADSRVSVDVEEFERAAAEARRIGDFSTYRSALGLYTGELLPQDLYEEWVGNRREAVRSLYLSLLIEFSRLAVAQGDLVSGVDALQRAVRSEPSLEEAHAELMRLYARMGQRQQALRQYRQLEQALEDLGAEPEASTRQLHEAIHAGRIPEVAVAAPLFDVSPGTRHNLPAAVSSFVGREMEIARTADLLEEARLVTIIGPGGVGKTRLATEVARKVEPRYRDGVWLVRVARLASPVLVSQAVARTLGVEEQPGQSVLEGLTTSLKSRELLLLLDNCEHLVDACADLAEQLLSACSRVRILATSRDMLGVTGEVVESIAPFASPNPEVQRDIGQLLEMDSIKLLVERIRYRQPAFHLTGANAPAAAQICRQVDGIPLAIELAAARAGTLSVEQIANRLSDTVGLLTFGSRTAEPRHRTLQATLDWSIELLTPLERSLFDRLSVFAGGWTLEAAEVIGTGEAEATGNVLDVLSRLVDQSLVVADVMPEGDVRYRMLAPIRQYAAQRLIADGRADQVRRRHAALFLTFAGRAEPQLRGPEQVAWLRRLSLERDNLRAALQWFALEDDEIHAGLQLAANLWQFWYLRGYLREGREWLQTMLTRASASQTLERAMALRGAGILASAQGEYEIATRFLEEALALYRILEPGSGSSSCLNSLGIIACEQGQYERAVALHEEALALRKRLGDDVDIAASLLNMGFAVHMQGDWQKSRDLHEEALILGREGGSTALIALCLHNLGYIALQRDEFDRAVPLLSESLALTRDVGEQRRLASCLEGLATAALRLGQAARAAKLYGAADGLRRSIGAPMYADERAEWEAMIERVRAGLSEQAFGQAWEAGQAMPMEEAVVYALATAEAEKDDVRGATSVTTKAKPVLSSRERQVVGLVAAGMTSREIAAELGITPRTVDTHVSKILRKLGLPTRARLAAWVEQQREDERA